MFIVVGPCSQMLYIKNKASQLLMNKNLRPSTHYLLSDIMIFRRRSWRTYLHHVSKQVQMKVHEIQENINNDDISTNHLYSHFTNMDKYSQYIYIYITLVPYVTEPPKSLGPPTVVLVQRTSDNPIDASNHLTSSVSISFTFCLRAFHPSLRYYNTSKERISGRNYSNLIYIKI
jgi:hypothetical protein